MLITPRSGSLFTNRRAMKKILKFNYNKSNGIVRAQKRPSEEPDNKWNGILRARTRSSEEPDVNFKRKRSSRHLETADTSKKRYVRKSPTTSVFAQCCSEDLLPGERPFSKPSTQRQCGSQAESNMHDIQDTHIVDVLPTTKDLSDMFYSNTYSIDELKAKCQNVCNEILKVEHVVNVYPTYTTNSTKRFVFVVVVENEFECTEERLQELGYDIEIKYKQPKYTKDNPGKDDYLLKHEFTDKLKNVIRKFGNTLMLKHTNVSFIRGCKYRLVTENENEIKYEPRLAVYVRAKGFIPIGEEPIAKSYDGVPVDVREGVCITFAGGRANDILENVKMGCQIKGHQLGSLGVLFENDYGLCGITCGHVVCSPKEMTRCMQTGGTVHFDTNNEVYQPKEPHTIGYLKKVIYKPGSDNEAGLDIGVIQLTDRPPIDGKFPIAKSAQSDLEFESGKAFEPKDVGEPCYKFGCVTEYTRSKIVCTSEEPTIARLVNGNNTLILHNQILVKTNGVSFADHGDSGSPVFIRACDGELVCIGIVEGGIQEDNDPIPSVYVTPITKILQELGISKLKSFSIMAKDIGELKRSVSRIEQKNETMAKDIGELKGSVSRIEQRNETMAKDIGELKGSVSRQEQPVINKRAYQCVCS